VRVVTNGFCQLDALEKWQARVLRWMAGLSVIVHAAGFLLASVLSPLFPPRTLPPILMVELTDVPLSTLPADEPPPISRVSPAHVPDSTGSRRIPAVPSRKSSRSASAEKWLSKLDAGLAGIVDAPVSRGAGKRGGIPIRQWENESPARPGDFAPAVAPEGKTLRKQITEIEERVRSVLVPGVAGGEDSGSEVMFERGEPGAGDPIPGWIRDMIRRKVLGYLPELESDYSVACRRNPALMGKLLVRFRIDPSGKVVTARVESASFGDDEFAREVLQRIRRWNFDPTDGRMVEVLYPFAFIAPS